MESLELHKQLGQLIKHMQHGGPYEQLISLLSDLLTQKEPCLQELLLSRHFTKFNDFYKNKGICKRYKDQATEILINLVRSSSQGHEILFCYHHCSSLLVTVIDTCSSNIVKALIETAMKFAEESLRAFNLLNLPSQNVTNAVYSTEETPQHEIIWKKGSCQPHEDYNFPPHPDAELDKLQKQIIKSMHGLDELEEKILGILSEGHDETSQELFVDGVKQSPTSAIDGVYLLCSKMKILIRASENKLSDALDGLDAKRRKLAKEYIQTFNNNWYRGTWTQWRVKICKDTEKSLSKPVKQKDNRLEVQGTPKSCMVNRSLIAIEEQKFGELAWQNTNYSSIRGRLDIDLHTTIEALDGTKTKVTIWLLIGMSYKLPLGVGVHRNHDFAEKRAKSCALRSYNHLLSLYSRKIAEASHKVLGFFESVAAQIICTWWKNFSLSYFSECRWILNGVKQNTLDTRAYHVPGKMSSAQDGLDNAIVHPWTVFITDSVLKKIKKSKVLLLQAFKRIKHLQRGDWTRSKSKEIKGSDHIVPLYQINVLDNLQMIWQVDVVYVHALRADSQVIKVWDIKDEVEIKSCLKRIELVQQTYSDIHKKNCHIMDTKGTGAFPKTFMNSSSAVSMTPVGSSSYAASDADLSDSLVALKFVPVSNVLLACILLGINAEFPFLLSKEEHMVIEETRSVLLLGRSGTGKTTCMVFRLYFSYKAREDLYFSARSNSLFSKILRGEEIPEIRKHQFSQQAHLHQLFVTMSPILCERVRKYFLKLKASMEAYSTDSTALKTALTSAQNSLEETEDFLLEEEDEENMFASIPNDFRKLKESHFPLFITYRKLLCMLIGTISGHLTYSEVDEKGRQHRKSEVNWLLKDEWHDEGGTMLFLPKDQSILARKTSAFDMDDNKHEGMGNNDKLSGKIPQSGNKNRGNHREENFEISQIVSWLNGREVTYDLFEGFYWPKIDERKTRQQNPCLVWVEIISLIKGSEMALSTEFGYLLREQYTTSSFRCFPTFEHNRELLYSIFEQYERIKTQAGHHDLMDSVFWIYNTMFKQGYTGVPIHEVYCDEVQDLSISQLKLLQLICKDPKGFFLSGDTAQTISRGSAFKFEEVSAMIYRGHQERVEKVTALTSDTSCLMPRSMQLTENYRSHGGILCLAASIVDLIELYFKGSIDSLKRDTALIGGPLPVFLEGTTLESLSLHLFGDGLSDDTLEFGAEQVILVRDQHSKEEVQVTLKTGLVMTIYEAKGLEFNDVLLFNFFENSPAQLKWRVLLGAVEGSQEGTFPNFDSMKHSILCSELKHLYTAITRARKQLWIFDSNSDIRLPMLKYWKSLNLVQVVSCSDNEKFLENHKRNALARKSTQEDWSRRGALYFEQRLYEHALFCFKKAGDDEKKLLCEANMKRQAAQRCLDEGNILEGNKLFYKAAELFKSIGRSQAAARSFLAGGYYIQAGKLLQSEGSFLQAAHAFVRGNDYRQAAECMEAANDYTEAVRLYKEGGLLEVAIKRMENLEYRQKINHQVLIRALQIFCLSLLHKAESVNSPDVAHRISNILSLFPSDESRQRFLQDYGCVGNLIQLYYGKQDSWSKESYIEAAEVHSRNGQKREAAEYYLKAAETFMSPNPRSVRGDSDLALKRNLIENSMECLILSIQKEITVMKLKFLPFSINKPGPLEENTKEVNEETGQRLQLQSTSGLTELIQNDLALLNQGKEAYLTSQSVYLSDFSEAKIRGTSVYSQRVDHIFLEYRVLTAQIEGNELDLQSCLANLTSSPEREFWIDCQLRVLLILCTSYKEGKIFLEWDTWVEYQRQLMGISEIFLNALRSEDNVGAQNGQILKLCERFFMVKPQDEESYLITEDPVNEDVIQMLLLWQADSIETKKKMDLILDETPSNSTSKVWRSLKSKSREAMRAVLGKMVHQILHFGSIEGRKGNALKEPCRAFSFGACHRKQCPYTHLLSISLQTSLDFLSRLVKQTQLAVFQVYLATQFSRYFKMEEIDVNSAWKLRRFWLEKLQTNLQLVSAFTSSSTATSQTVKAQQMPKNALIELISHIWLGKEYSHSEADRVLEALYILVQFSYKSIPSFFLHKFLSEVEMDGHCLPPGLVFCYNSRGQRFIRPVHSWLIHMLRCCNQGNAWSFVYYGTRYVRYILNRRNQISFEKSWNVLWLLEVMMGVAIAMKRSFCNIVLPSSVIRCFFQSHRDLCQGILHSNFEMLDCSTLLFNLCGLVVNLWYQRILTSPCEDQRWGLTLRVQTFLAVSGCHLNSKQLAGIWHTMKEINNELCSVPESLGLSTAVQASSFSRLYKALNDVLKHSLEPLVAVRHTRFSGSSPWFLEGIETTLEIDDTGFLKQQSVKCDSEEKDLSEIDGTGVTEAPVTTLENIELDSIQEEEDFAVSDEFENTMKRQVEAVITLQCWYRRFRTAKRRTYERNHAWDRVFTEALQAVRKWSNRVDQDNENCCTENAEIRRYGMYFLGQVLPRFYEARRMLHSVDARIRSVKRKTSKKQANQSDLEYQLQYIDDLSDVKDDLARCLGFLSVENEKHLEANLSLLVTVYEKSEENLRKSKCLLSATSSCQQEADYSDKHIRD